VQSRFVLGVSITPGDVGSRVSVRRRLPRGGLGDVVGDLIRWSDGRLTVVRRDRSVVDIDEDALIAGKRVPPAAPRFGGGPARVRELQRIAAHSWPPRQTAPLGGWLLRAAHGWTMRANSVLVLAAPGLPVGEAVDRVEGWYADRRLPAIFSIPDELAGDLEPELTARGWPPAQRRIEVMIAAVREVPAAADPGLPDVALTAAPDAGWLGCYRARGERVPEVGIAVLTGNPSAVFASISLDGEVVAIGRSTLDEGWLGISAVETAPDARRRGLARHLVAALVAHGTSAGARRTYLQVSDENAAAIALYTGLGFIRHHCYAYRACGAPRRR
jgi:GNAT superfamily N-acetyltransferase